METVTWEEGRVAQKLPSGKRKKGRTQTRAIICENQPEALARLEDLPKPLETCYGIRVRFMRRWGAGYWEAYSISRLEAPPPADLTSPASLFFKLKGLLESHGLIVSPEHFDDLVSQRTASGVPYAAFIVDDVYGLLRRPQWRESFTYVGRVGEALEALADRCVRDVNRKWTKEGGLLQPLRELRSKRLAGWAGSGRAAVDGHHLADVDLSGLLRSAARGPVPAHIAGLVQKIGDRGAALRSQHRLAKRRPLGEHAQAILRDESSTAELDSALAISLRNLLSGTLHSTETEELLEELFPVLRAIMERMEETKVLREGLVRGAEALRSGAAEQPALGRGGVAASRGQAVTAAGASARIQASPAGAASRAPPPELIRASQSSPSTAGPSGAMRPVLSHSAGTSRPISQASDAAKPLRSLLAKPRPAYSARPGEPAAASTSRALQWDPKFIKPDGGVAPKKVRLVSGTAGSAGPSSAPSRSRRPQTPAKRLVRPKARPLGPPRQPLAGHSQGSA